MYTRFPVSFMIRQIIKLNNFVRFFMISYARTLYAVRGTAGF